MPCLRYPRKTTLLVVGGDGSQVGISGTSKSRTAVILPGVSFGEPDLQYVEYVPRLVPRGARSTSKRTRADDSSTSASASKKPRPPGAQITGRMLLGEHIIVLHLPFFSGFFPHLSSFVCSYGNVVELFEDEEEDDSAALVTHR